MKAKLEVGDDPIDDLMIFYENNDSHLPSTLRTEEGIHLVDLADHLSPAFRGHIAWFFFNDRRRGES